jgi:transposase
MMYVGLDAHKSFTSMGSFDPATGELQDLGRVPTEPEQLGKALAALPDPNIVVLEAGRNSWWLAAQLEPHADQVWVVDPKAVRMLEKGRPKTDRRDASALARWAARGALTPLWRPDAQTMDLRELTRGRNALVGMATRMRNMIRALCARHGQELPKGADVLGARVQARLDSMQLHGWAAQVLALLRQLLPLLNQAATALEVPIQQQARTHPAARKLMSLPGVGPVLALTIAAEIGDISRFPTRAQLRSYSGLCPALHQSGPRTHTGPLTKRGNRWLRWAAVLAAQQVARASYPDNRLKRLWRRVLFRHGPNPAKTAVARALLDLIHHLLTAQEDYRPTRLVAA